MKMQRLIIILFLFFYSASPAQLFTENVYPKGYFRNPLGIPLQLSANFGELRTNHYHMGFDIRTNQRENLPVYAAADGFVSRVSIERYGFGRAIYIQHPNGYTTVYAHLNDLYPGLNAFIKNKQYAEEKWEQNIEFEPGQFPVVKSQFIANSGNTGGSAGPHLHFEVRDTKTGNNLNPWLFNFGLADKIAPFIYRMFLYDRRFSTYQVAPTEIKIKKIASGYTSRDNVVIIPTPAFSFGISAEDKTNTSPFLFGIYQAEIYVDDTARFAFRLNDFSYNESRLVNAAIDYRTRFTGGPYIQHLSRLPGNHGSIFSKAAADGVVIAADTLVHKAVIRVRDAQGNESTLRFNFRYEPSLQQDRMFAQNFISLLPNQENKIAFDDIQVDFPASSFYHMVPFVYSATTAMNAASNIHQLHNFTVPVNDSFTVRLKLNEQVPDTLRNKVVMQLLSNRKKVATKGEWNSNWMSAKFWDLGSVRLLVDTIPPVINTSGWTNGSNVKGRKSISLLVRDAVGEIKSFRAELDGKWLMFRRKDDLFIHDFDEHTSAGKHSLRIIAEDQAGNVSENIYTFTR
jgi:hypothetical protein